MSKKGVKHGPYKYTPEYTAMYDYVRQRVRNRWRLSGIPLVILAARSGYAYHTVQKALYGEKSTIPYVSLEVYNALDNSLDCILNEL